MLAYSRESAGEPMKPSVKALLPHIAIIFSVMLWSSSFVAIRQATASFSSEGMALLRFAIASLVLTIPFIFKSKFISPSRSDCLRIIVVGIGGIALYSALLNEGEKFIPTGVSSFLIGQTPLVSALLAIIFLKEKFSKQLAIGFILSLAGISAMAINLRMDGEVPIQLFFIVLACILGAVQTILQKSLLNNLPVLHTTAYATWFGTMFLSFFAADNLKLDFVDVNTRSLTAIIYLGTVPSIAGQMLWSYGLSYMPTLRACMYLYLMPLMSSLLAWWLLGEPLEKSTLLGGFIAIAGAYIALHKPVFAWQPIAMLNKFFKN